MNSAVITTQRVAILRKRIEAGKPIPAYDAPLAARIEEYLDWCDCTCELDSFYCWYRLSADQQNELIVAAISPAGARQGDSA